MSKTLGHIVLDRGDERGKPYNCNQYSKGLPLNLCVEICSKQLQDLYDKETTGIDTILNKIEIKKLTVALASVGYSIERPKIKKQKHDDSEKIKKLSDERAEKMRMVSLAGKDSLAKWATDSDHFVALYAKTRLQNL